MERYTIALIVLFSVIMLMVFVWVIYKCQGNERYDSVNVMTYIEQLEEIDTEKGASLVPSLAPAKTSETRDEMAAISPTRVGKSRPANVPSTFGYLRGRE
jgi:hypothetical protein